MPLLSRRNYYSMFIVLFFLALTVSCSLGPSSRPPSGEATPLPALTEIQTLPTYTPTPQALGSQENPVLIGFVSPSNNTTAAQSQSLEWISKNISNLSGYDVKFVTFEHYILLEQALQAGDLHMAWVQPIEYLLASEKGLLTALLVSNHLGVTAYGVQFVGNASSNFINYFDAGTNQSTAPAETALAQLAGLRPCLSSTTSLSGYWVPIGYMKKANIGFQDPVLTHSHSASLRALYIRGVCDYAVTYAISADPRTSSEVIQDLPDVLSKLPIIWVSPPVIPSLVLASSPSLDSVIQNRIVEALLSMAQTQDGREQISFGLNYEISSLQPFQDSGFTELRTLLASVNLRLNTLLPPR